MIVYREGYPWVGIPALFSALSFLAGKKKLGLAGLFVTGFNTYFFRNPRRDAPIYKEFLVSPADGKVVVCKIEKKEEWYPEPLYRIGIFMRFWDVHINRSPVSGKVPRMSYFKGERNPVFSEEAFQKNEKQVYLIEREDGLPVWLVQIAGVIARRIKSFVLPGDDLLAGEPIGIIKFGSRVEIFFPASEAQLLVKTGHRVFAGETVIARIPFAI